MLPNTGTLTLGTTPQLLFELRLLPRKDMIITNLSSGTQQVIVSEGQPPQNGSGVVLLPGSSYSLQPGTVSFGRVWVVSNSAGATINYLERVF